MHKQVIIENGGTKNESYYVTQGAETVIHS